MFPTSPQEMAKVPCETEIEEGVPEQLGLRIVAWVVIAGIVVALSLFVIGGKEIFKIVVKDILRQVLTPHF